MKTESISVEQFLQELTNPPKKPKYRNKKVVIDGITFDSIKEGNRYKELKLMEKAGEIYNLQTQVRFHIVLCGELICTYISDFVYIDRKNKEVYPYSDLILSGTFYNTVEDVKSEITRKNPVYRIKKKLMKAIYNIDIVEI